MSYQALVRIFAILMFGSLANSNAIARNIYLNGVDISGAFNQPLEQVDILIDEKGDIFITAPQYVAREQGSLTPLRANSPSRLAPDAQIAQPMAPTGQSSDSAAPEHPEHKALQGITKKPLENLPATPRASDEAAAPSLIPKAGEPIVKPADTTLVNP
jgi:hypothetical protein